MSGILWPIEGRWPITQNFAGGYYVEAPGYLLTDSGGPRKAKKVKFPGSVYYHDLHAAIDVACPEGTPVRAVAAGTIVAAGSYWQTGEHYIILRFHKSATRQTLFFATHLSKIKVVVGEKVARGEVIALSGNSGWSSGPHLHFEIRTFPPNLDPGLSTSSSRTLRWNPVRLQEGGDMAGISWLT